MLGFLPNELAGPTKRPTVEIAALGLMAEADDAALYVRTVRSMRDFEAITVAADDAVSNGRLTKFLIDLREPGSPKLYVINSQFRRGGSTPPSAQYHYRFAEEVLNVTETLEQFNEETYFTSDKRFAAGTLHSYDLDAITSDDAGQKTSLLGASFFPSDVINEGGILDVMKVVASEVSIPGRPLTFVPTGPQQTYGTVASALNEQGIEIRSQESLLGSVRYIPLNVGEAWGTVRLFPAAEVQLEPGDIPVFDELPLDLSVVAGVVTRAFQDAASHVNLKSKERGTPNMVLRDVSRDTEPFHGLDGQPAHLVVAGDGFTLEGVSPEEVARHRPGPPPGPPIHLALESDQRVRPFADLASRSAGDALTAASRYGGKAAGLAFLAHPDALQMSGASPAGVAVPLQFYVDTVEHPANSELRRVLGQLFASLDTGTTSAAERSKLIDVVQLAFMAAELPAGHLSAISSQIREVLPGVKKVKVRSSANAEDVPNFDGAGLHDSFAAVIGNDDDGPCRVVDHGRGDEVKREVEPKTLGCAVRGVYASLWNPRAVAERAFANIDQRTAAMGLAIVGSYDEQAAVVANAVVVTRVLNARGNLGYTLSVQLGNNLVTNPDAGTWSESSIASLVTADGTPVISVTRFAKPVANGPVRTESCVGPEKMQVLVDLARKVELAYCDAKPSYYRATADRGQPARRCANVPTDEYKPTALDMEFKFLESGRVLCKQVREFSGR